MITVIDGVNERVLRIMLLKNGKEVSSLSWITVYSFIHKILVNLLPPKPKSSFRHLKQGIQEFHRKYVLVPADKAANNAVVVCRLHYVNTLKQELDGTRAYLETDTDETSVVNAHLNDLPVKFSVSMKAKTNFLRCTGYLSFTKDHTKLDILQIVALVLLLSFLNY